MRIIDSKVILYFEPKNNKSTEPIIDELTIKMFNALNNAFKNTAETAGIIGRNNKFQKGISTMGTHECVCGVHSHACDYLLEGGYMTNSLCVHYLAYHRDEVTQDDINKINDLNASTVLSENDSNKLMYMIDDWISKLDGEIDLSIEINQEIIDESNNKEVIKMIEENMKHVSIPLSKK